MSDREKLIDLALTGRPDQGIQLYIDGESGTWRLILLPSLEPVDLTLVELNHLKDGFVHVCELAARDPDEYNAEVRAARNVEPVEPVEPVEMELNDRTPG